MNAAMMGRDQQASCRRRQDERVAVEQYFAVYTIQRDMLLEHARRWCEAELATYGRAAQPSDDRFPALAALIADDEAPEPVRAARDFYREGCFDWGSAWIFRYSVGEEPLFIVYAGTDGDTGWLELYDRSGALISTATLDGDRVHWEARDTARARVASGEMPT